MQNLTKREEDRNIRCKILQEELKILQGYYIVTVEKRRQFLELYVKCIAIPVGAIAALFLFLARISFMSVEEESGNGIGIIESYVGYFGACLLFFGLAGLVLLITYSLESSNAGKYLGAIRDAREGIRKQFPDISKYISLSDRRRENQKNRLGILISVRFWRGCFISVLNSGVFVFSLYFLG